VPHYDSSKYKIVAQHKNLIIHWDGRGIIRWEDTVGRFWNVVDLTLGISHTPQSKLVITERL